MNAPRPGWRRAALAALALVVVTLVMLALRGRLDKAHVALVYLLVVLGGSAAEGRRVGLALGGAAFLSFNFLFLPPYYTFTIADPLDWLVLVAFLVTSVVAAELLARLKGQANLARQRTIELDRLATLGAETLNAARADQALAAIATVIRSTIGVDECALFVREGATLRAVNATAPGDRQAPIDPASLLGYVVQFGQAAIERGDATLRILGVGSIGESVEPIDHVRALALPLTVRGETVGALRLMSATEFTVKEAQRRVLVTLAYYAALGVERLRLERTEETADALRRSDRLKDALLASVSHDLRTPLTTIKAIANEIGHGGDPSRARVIEDEADRLSGLVDGLLQLSQLDAGALPLEIELNTVDDLVGAALQRAEGALGDHPVDVDIDAHRVLAGRFDFAHSMRILINLLENAAKYSPRGAPITVSAARHGGRIAVAVADRGIGIDLSEHERIFHPFYRVPGATPDVRGAGLGLAIASRLAVAQGGRLRVEARPGGGSVFVLEFAAVDAPAA